MKLFDDTIKMDAHLYLTSDGDVTTRDDLLREMRDSYPIYMVYLGGGFVPLKLAVQAFTCEGNAWEAVQERARKADRLDEIGEDVECPECAHDEYDDAGMGHEVMTQMHWTVNKNDEGVNIWVCPQCLWECAQPDSYGQVEVVIQQVPRSLLETAWVLTRPFQGASVDIFPATTQHIEGKLPLASVSQETLESILSEEQMNDLHSVYEVVTDSSKAGELTR